MKRFRIMGLLRYSVSALCGFCFINYGGQIAEATDIEARTSTSDVNSGFSVNNFAGTTLLRVRGDGNVGIGTTAPGFVFHVERSVDGEAGTMVRNLNAGVSAFSILRLGNNTGTNAVFFLNSSGRAADGGVNTATLRNDAGDLNLQSAGGLGIRVMGTTGNVGIGTAGPIDRLQISNPGNVRVVLRPDSGANDRESLVDFWTTFDANPDTGVRRAGRIQVGFDGGAWGTEYMAFGVAGAGDAASPPTERMRINAAGNVGIGTTAPLSRLGVVGGLISTGDTNTRFGAQISGDDGGRGVFGSNLYIGSDGQFRTFGGHASYGYSGISAGSGQLEFHAASGATTQDAIVPSSTRMIITPAGNVGIGTTTPAGRLHVHSGVGITPTPQFITNNYSGQNTSGGDITISQLFLGNLSFQAGIQARIPNMGWGDLVRLDFTTPAGSNDNTQVTRMSIMPFSGNVGIGLTGPTWRLQLPNIASAAGQGLANAWLTYSSRRWKENIQPIEDALDKVLKLRGVSFDWKEEYGGHHDIGLIAEEVGEVIPEVVTYEENGKDAGALDYARLTAVLIEAVKAQQQQIEALKQEMAALKVTITGSNLDI